MKQCSRCRQIKPATDYYRKHDTRDGLQDRCKQCCKDYAKAWQRQNPKRHRHIVDKYEQRNPDRHREYNRRWAAKCRERYHNDPAYREHKRAYNREYSARRRGRITLSPDPAE